MLNYCNTFIRKLIIICYNDFIISQFQLSIARKMLNGQLSKEEYSESDEGRRALGILKKSELHSGVRHGLGHSVAKLPQTKNVNRIEPTIKVFEVKFLF